MSIIGKNSFSVGYFAQSASINTFDLMKLYLLRHAEAQSTYPDEDRVLSERGRNTVVALANLLKAKEVIAIDEIRHSTLVRTGETAQILSAEMNLDLPLNEIDGLAPSDNVHTLVDQLQVEEKNIMLVGHLPQLAILASTLVTRVEVPILFNLNTCGLIAFERYEGHSIDEDDNPHWVVQWMLDSQLYAG